MGKNGSQVARENCLQIGARLVFIDLELINLTSYLTTVTDFKTKREKNVTVFRHHFKHETGGVVYSGQLLPIKSGDFCHIKGTIKRFEYVRGKRYVRLARPFLLPNDVLSFTDF